MSGPHEHNPLLALYHGSTINMPTMTVEAKIDFGHGAEATICKLEIELIHERFIPSADKQRGEEQIIQDFTLRLSVERGDGTVGLHQRSLSGFEWHKYNAVWLIAHAFAQFDDVTEKEPFTP